MHCGGTSPSPPTLQRWDSVFITNGENGEIDKSKLSKLSKYFYTYTRIRTRGCICFAILLALPALLARGKNEECFLGGSKAIVMKKEIVLKNKAILHFDREVQMISYILTMAFSALGFDEVSTRTRRRRDKGYLTFWGLLWRIC